MDPRAVRKGNELPQPFYGSWEPGSHELRRRRGAAHDLAWISLDLDLARVLEAEGSNRGCQDDAEEGVELRWKLGVDECKEPSKLGEMCGREPEVVERKREGGSTRQAR